MAQFYRLLFRFFAVLTATYLWTPSATFAVDDDVTVATCQPEQTPAQYSLRKAAETPWWEPLPFPAPGTTLVPPAMRQNNVRLDLCINVDGTLELKQFVTIQRTPAGLGPRVKNVVPEDRVDLTSLTEFVFTENVKDLKLTLPGTDHVDHFELQGWNVQGQEFVTWTAWIRNDDNTLSNLPSVAFGRLELGDFTRSHAQCQPFEGFAQGAYQVEDVSVKVSYCTFRGGGRTQGMRLVGLELNGASLSTPVKLGESELAPKGVLFTYYHHNSCDALSIDLPQIKLGLRSIATVSREDRNCIEAFHLAPGRPATGGGDLGLLFNLEIPGMMKSQGYIPQCRHVLDCSPP